MSDSDPRYFAARDAGPIPPVRRMTGDEFERAMEAVNAVELARKLDSAPSGHHSVQERKLARALLATDEMLREAQRELVDVEVDRRYQQDRARKVEQQFRRHVETMIEPKLIARAEAAESLLEEAREALRPFAENWDFHAADYLAELIDGKEMRVIDASVVNEIIAAVNNARAFLAKLEAR